MDPDQSNASEAFWRSGSIHRVGLGRVALDMLASFQFFCFLAINTPLFAIWTIYVLWIFHKNAKNYYVFLMYFWLFLWYFHMRKMDKNDMCQFLIWLVHFVFLWEVSCIIFNPNIYHLILMLGIWFHDGVTFDFMLIHQNVLVRFLFAFFTLCSILLSLIFVYNFYNVFNFVKFDLCLQIFYNMFKLCRFDVCFPIFCNFSPTLLNWILFTILQYFQSC